MNAAAKRFENFTGHKAEFVDRIKMESYDTAFLIGDLDGLLYTTVRDGEKESYIHKFKKKSRPQLASSFDGKQLFILGGGYRFTERGIIDKK